MRCGHASSHSCRSHTSHGTRPRSGTLLSWHRHRGHARTPQNLGNIRSGSSIYAYNIPSSIGASPRSSEVNSGSSSRGGGVNARGRDGSGCIKFLPTYGVSNLVPARLCVGLSLCILSIFIKLTIWNTHIKTRCFNIVV